MTTLTLILGEHDRELGLLALIKREAIMVEYAFGFHRKTKR